MRCHTVAAVNDPGRTSASPASQSPARTTSGRPPRRAFTLFELILAIALSATLLALIGTAVNLYLTSVDAGRMRVEEAQLARSILAMIADDIRAATVYQPQDTSAVARLMENATPFDVDSIDDPRLGSDDSSAGSPGTTYGAGGTSGASPASGASVIGSSSSSGSTATADDSEMPLGLSGSFTELYVDAMRLPPRDELFSTVTGYTNAPLPTSGQTIGASAMLPTGITPPTDLKTVRYFIRLGDQVEPASIAATSLAPTSPSPMGEGARGGGLVRQEIPRALRIWAEQTGNSAVLDGGQALLAPEVCHIEFRYYDGSQVVDVWEMSERKSLPRAVEVRIWLTRPEDAGPLLPYDIASRIANARMYRQTVYLPMSELASAQQPSGTSGTAGGSESSSGDMENGGNSAFEGPEGDF